eukprot:9491726-Pyramimonas_sp.AAC.1
MPGFCHPSLNHSVRVLFLLCCLRFLSLTPGRRKNNAPSVENPELTSATSLPEEFGPDYSRDSETLLRETPRVVTHVSHVAAHVAQNLIASSLAGLPSPRGGRTEISADALAGPSHGEPAWRPTWTHVVAPVAQKLTEPIAWERHVR